MKNLRLIACVLCTVVVVLLESGCASTSPSEAQVRESRTYAIIAADAQGALSQTELNSIVETLVQFLLDQGYVRSDQILIDDPGRAAVVFRMKIAWNEGRTSFAVVSVASGSGSERVYAEPPPAYATAAPPPEAPLPDNDWNNDPWRNGDGFGWGYDPYWPVFVGFPFTFYDGFHRHHRPQPPLTRRPPEQHRPTEHHERDWGQDRHYESGDPSHEGPSAQRSAPTQRSYPPRHDSVTPSAPRNNPAPDHRAQSSNHSPTRPQTRDQEHSQAPDHPTHRRDSNVNASPTPVPRHESVSSRTSPSPAAVPAREPAHSPRPSPPPMRENSPSTARNPTPDVVHVSPPATSSHSDTDSKSKTKDRDQ
jgi:hypothetical protein